MMRIPRKAELLLGCALGAVMAAAAQPAQAQSFNGTPTVVTGTASVFTGPGSTSVFVATPETVINWSTVDTGGTGAIDFQPAGTTAVFSSDPAFTNYTVLNRILPVDTLDNPTNATVAFNGTVLSLLGNNPGGNIWFYSPTGIIAGPTAVFNVGSLILTTNDIAFVPDPGGSIYGPGGLVQFSGPSGSTGFVDVRPGAQINAIGLSDAYVALVAPRVVQGGTVTANGQVAYIAAEQVDMTISTGLFDFTVEVGTTDANGIVHTGTTTGPASTTLLDTQRISMVAVPKNDALTMLLSGSIGYTPAASVEDDGSSIVLSAGFATDDPSTFSGAPDSSIEIGNATFANALTAWATDGIHVLPQGGTTTFGGNTSLRAGEIVQVQATADEFVIADLDLSIAAGRPGTGGTIDLLAQTTLSGGVIDVAGALGLNASSDGILAGTSPLAGQGGTIAIDANGGTIEAASIFASAAGAGNPGTAAGTGTGGTVDALVRNGGTISAAFVNLDARGYGGEGEASGGDGIGGTVNVTDNGGTLGFGSVLLNAGATGGSASGTAGDGIGGTVVVAINQQAQLWNELSIDTSSTSGRQALVGEGLTGSASGSVDGAILRITGPGSLELTGNLTMISNAYTDVNGAPGFSGTAGEVLVEVENGGALTVAGRLSAQASALQSSGLGLGEIPASAPVQAGGSVTITADGGRITANMLHASAEAEGLFAQTTAGSATGGEVTVSALDGGRIETSLARISANAYGAPGPVPADAQGGIARVVVSDAEFAVSGDLEISADAASQLFGVPPAGPGFNAAGGSATIELLAGSLGTAILTADDVYMSASGNAGLKIATFVGEGMPPGLDPRPIQGDGGTGTGGIAGLTMQGGTLSVDELTIDASGIGGASGISPSTVPFRSGDGIGGVSTIDLADGEFSLGAVTLGATGTGGAGGGVGGAQGGHGYGGAARFALIDSAAGPTGARGLDSLLIDASGVGGAGSSSIAQSSTGEVDLIVSVRDPASALALPGSLTVYAGGLNQTATGGIQALISGAPLQVGSDVILSSGGPVAISAQQPLRGGTSVTLSGRTVTTTGLLQSAGPMSVEGSFGINADRLTSGGTTSLDATGGPGAITVADLLSSGSVTTAGASIDIRSSGSLAFDGAAALTGDASILTAGALTVANIAASDEIDLVSGGTFTLSGTARGVSIDVTSPDIVLGAGAALGVRGTTRDLTLRNGDGERETFIGGESGGVGYGLDRNEAARMFADQSITILADDDITIGDLALSFGTGANIGTGGTLEISSPDEITITGDVALTTSSADDTFRIDPRLIALRTDTGSISMSTGVGGGGTPQGRLELVGDRIVAATAANIAQLESMTDLDAISLLLGQPGGSGEPLSAGTIHIDAADALFIQNSGASDAFADRRGFAASGFAIVTGSSVTQIAVNGRIITPAGEVTGLAVTPLVTINGAPAAAGGQFHARSTINGCVIGANCAPPPELDLPTREDVRGPVPGEGGGSLFASPLIELAATDPLITPPLVDEPITGVGNDDLWEPRCEPGEEDNPCPEDDGQP